MPGTTALPIALCAAALLNGCGKLTVISNPGPTPTPPPPPVVAVVISPTTASVNGLKSQAFQATVTGTNNMAVTWSVSGPGCSGASCGSIATNGVYKAPATVPSPPSVTVTATSNADNSKTASCVVTVLPTLPVVVAVTPRTATLLDNKSVNLAALVTNTLNTDVSWRLSSSGCAGAACGTISTSGIYTAPAAVPPAPVIATATSQADPTKTDQAAITVVDTAEALITGTYIYLLDSRSWSAGFTAVGSITFQPGGTFIASEDGEFSSGASNPDAWSGTYTIGSEGRGTVTGTGTHIGTRSLRISVLPGDEIRFIEFNSAGRRTSGVMRRANATGASLAGDWAFEFSGVDPTGSPMGTIGTMQLDSSNITGIFALAYSGGYTGSRLNGNYTPPIAGRSSVQLVGLKQTLNWAFYVVNDNELFWVMSGSRDPVITELSGRAVRRSGGSFAASDLDATAVLNLTGSVWISAGRVTFDGAISDANIRDQRANSGSVNENSLFTDNYWVDPGGHGELGSGYALCVTGSNQGFVLEESGDVMLGEFSPQIGPFSSAALDGTYNLGSERPGYSNTGLTVGVLTISNGSLSGIVDISLPGSDTAGQAVTGSILSFDPATGRGTAALNLPGMSKTVFYVLSSGQLVLLPMSAAIVGVDDIGSVIIAGR